MARHLRRHLPLVHLGARSPHRALWFFARLVRQPVDQHESVVHLASGDRRNAQRRVADFSAVKRAQKQPCSSACHRPGRLWNWHLCA